MILGTDGLPARSTGPWALEKLRPLERYCDIVTTSMKEKFDGLVFLDLMAGPGVCVDTISRPQSEFMGSTLRALDTRYPFNRIVAVEADPTCAAALLQRVQRTKNAHLVQVAQRDCNDPDLVEEIRATCRGCLTIAFIDLLGTEVRMDTIRRLTFDRTVDLVITWPEMDAVRNRGAMLEQGERWDAFFGTTAWRDVARDFGPAFRVRRLQLLYVQQLRQVGYRHARFMGSVKNRRKRALYRPLFASRKEIGLRFWMSAAERPGGQGHLMFDQA